MVTMPMVGNGGIAIGVRNLIHGETIKLERVMKAFGLQNGLSKDIRYANCLSSVAIRLLNLGVSLSKI